MAYTTIFALPGVIILVVAIAGLFYDADQVRHAVYGQFGSFIGTDTSTQFAHVVDQADKHRSGTIAKILGVLALFGPTSPPSSSCSGRSTPMSVPARP